MRKILVLGGTGMLGHKMFQILGERFPETCCTTLEPPGATILEKVPLFTEDRVITGLDVTNEAALRNVLANVRPDVIVNCVGIIKQRPEAHDAVLSISLNSLLPHRLALACSEWGGRLIHFSTDCVFSGRSGGYREESVSDAEDLYGRSKFLGEVQGPNALTLRTSIIGRELQQLASLLEWFLSQKGRTVKGFRRVLYSGVTTNYLAGVVAEIIEHHETMNGLYQVTGPTITKYDLLCGIRDAFDLDVTIVHDDETVSDRSMIGDRFVQVTGLETPDWPELLRQLAADSTPYASWRPL